MSVANDLDQDMDHAKAVIAICASAADTGSLETLLERLPSQADAAIVLVLSHREALDLDRFSAVAQESGHPVSRIADGDRIEGGQLYLHEPDVIVTLEGGRLRVRPAEELPGERGTIDSFLISLARTETASGIAVVLAGTLSDGTLGFKAIKEAGGLALAEETEASRSGHLATSDDAVALADAVLPVEALADRIATYVSEIGRHGTEPSGGATEKAIVPLLPAVAAILRNRTGHDFHGYKPGTFVRRIQRRMHVAQTDDIEAYLEQLRAQPEEVQQLFNDLLIGVTSFFRDPEEFVLLEKEVVPKLFADKGRNDQLRIWVIGCSTGEEAYSLGILLREHMANLEVVPQIQIFATDLDGRALAASRAGRYPESIAQDLTPERLARWFVREGNTYCVVKELREMCIFSQHSIVKDAPFSRIDLVSCRNLLIYLDTELQSQVIPLLHFAVKPRGYLFLGNSENVSRHTKLFGPIAGRSRIFLRRDGEVRALPHFPLPTAGRAPIGRRSLGLDQASLLGASLAKRAERVADRYAPAYVVIDDDFNVLHFSGRTGRFIDPAGGSASLNLLQLAHPDLRPSLRTALGEAADLDETVKVEGLRLGQNGHALAVDLVVEPIRAADEAVGGYFVLFKDGAKLPSGNEPAASGDQRDHVQRLESELRTTRERLQATNEELETTNEELKASNEEYQALNEELQAANEELQTSKEELQSINEELTTVNGELAHRVHDLGRANSDLKNLIESTQIATIFLDNDLRVASFTPATAEIFHLIGSDEGRPIGHIKALVEYDELLDDVRRVMRTLSLVEREVRNAETGARYMVRVLPYRSTDNYIAGVVLTFVDVTPLKRAEEALRESQSHQRALIEGVPLLVWRATDGGYWTWSSPQWTQYTGLSEEESRGLGWHKALHPDDREAMAAFWREAQISGHLTMEGRILHAQENRYRWFQTRATALRDGNGVTVEWLGTSSDIDDLRKLQERQLVMVAELQHRTRNLIAVVRSVARQTMEGSDSLDSFGQAFNERLSALARVQGLLSRADRERITIDALIRSELDSVGASELHGRVTWQGPEVALRNSTVQTLALGIHELATNARKHGALANGHGRLTVRWSVRNEDGRRLLVEWEEDGIQPSSDDGAGRPANGGYGRELIERAIPYALGARTSFDLGLTSLRCVIDLPLDKHADRHLLSEDFGAEDG